MYYKNNDLKLTVFPPQFSATKVEQKHSCDTKFWKITVSYLSTYYRIFLLSPDTLICLER